MHFQDTITSKITIERNRNTKIPHKNNYLAPLIETQIDTSCVEISGEMVVANCPDHELKLNITATSLSHT